MAIVVQHVQKHAADSPKALETAGNVFNACLTSSELYKYAPLHGPMRRHGRRLNLIRSCGADERKLYNELSRAKLITDECTEEWYTRHLRSGWLVCALEERGSLYTKRTPEWCAQYFSHDMRLYDVAKVSGILGDVNADWFASCLEGELLSDALEYAGIFETDELDVQWLTDHFDGHLLFCALLMAGHLDDPHDVYWCTSHIFVEKRVSLMLLVHDRLLEDFLIVKLRNADLRSFYEGFTGEAYAADVTLSTICTALFSDEELENDFHESDFLWDSLFPSRSRVTAHRAANVPPFQPA